MNPERVYHVGARAIVAFLGLLLAAGSATPKAAIPSEGLVLHLPLDETTGLVAADASGNGHNGTLGNFVGDDSQWGAGEVGGALSFSRAGTTYVEVPGLPEINSTTWAAWVKLTSNPNFDAIISSTFPNDSAGHSLGFHTAGTARHPRIVWNHNVGNTILLSPDPIPLDEWHHVALTYDSASKTMILYVDGVEKIRSETAQSTPFQSINLGRREATAANYLDGALDEVTVYNRALGPLEIKTLAGQVVTGPPVVLTHPEARTVFEGESASFTVAVEGLAPFSFQWRRNGVEITGATEATLALTGLTPAQAGEYDVVITNADGKTTSEPAVLTVTPTDNFTVGLTAHWKFDETSGLTATDATGNGHIGDLISFAGDDSQWVPGKVGGGIRFNGANFVQVPDAPGIGSDLVNRMTVAAWFKSDVPLSATGSGNRMLEKGNSYFFLQGVANGGMNFLVKQGGANRTAGILRSLDANTWYHIAGTFDGSNVRVYIDGELQNTIAVNGVIDATTLPLIIGADDAGAFFRGVMDEVMIWKRALSDSEILNVIGRDLPNPPSIVLQPESVEKFAGSTATFTVDVRGKEPFRYLWYKGTQEIRTATQPTLVIENIQPEDAGEYRVHVSNELGEIDSQTVTLSVIPVEGLTTGLRAQWKFDETSGLVATDASGNGNDGELVGFNDETSHWVEGQVGGALRLDGVLNRVVVPDDESLQVGDEPSFTFWVKPSSYGTEMIASSFTFKEGQIIRKGGHIDIYTVDNPGGVRETIIANGDNAPPTSLQLDTWQHFAIVYRNGMVHFFKNGFPIGEPQPGSLGATNDLALVLGNFDALAETFQFYAGDMDEVSIWARPLDESEVLELAGQDVSGPPQFALAPQAPAPKLEGGTVTFSALVTGQRPLTFQWLRNGEPIAGATSSQLTLTELTAADAGEYTLRVSNAIDTIISQPVQLTVEAITDVTSGLIAYWTFDETSGTTLPDHSGNNHHGELKNFTAVEGVLGQIGGAFDFDGIDDFIVVPHHEQLNITDRATISAWISPRTYAVQGGISRIVRKSINYDFSISSANNSMIFYDGQKVIFNAPRDQVTLNSWQHVALVINEGTIQFFLNGQPLTEPLEGARILTDGNPLIIGNFQPDLAINRIFNGLMDELGIWNRALSLSEIDGIYQNGLLGKPLTAEFEPLNIRSLTVTAPSQVDILFFSPFAEREYRVETIGDLNATWSEQADVQFAEQGQGLIKASFSAATESAGFYRIAAMPIPPLFTEDFESGAAGWTHGGAQDNWELGTPAQGPQAAHSGANVYGTGLSSNVGQFTDAFLRSPVIDLTGINSATLRFWEWRNLDPEVLFHQAIVNVIDADTNIVLQELARDAGPSGGWQERSLRLGPDAVGKRIMIEFRVVTDQFNLLEGWFIDDVTLGRE